MLVHQRGVEHRALDEVAGGEQVAEDGGLEGVEAHGDVRRSPREHDLRLLVLRHAEVQREDPAVLEGRQRELALDLRQFDQERQGRAHVAVLGDLLPTRRLLEVQVRRNMLLVCEQHVHRDALLGVELRGDRGDHGGGLADGAAERLRRLAAVLAEHVVHLGHQDVDLRDFGGGRQGPGLGEGLAGGHVRQNDGVTLQGLLLHARGRKGPHEVQASSRGPVDDILGVDHLEIFDVEAAVRPEDVHLSSLASDRGICIREEGRDQVQAEVHATLRVVRVRKRREVFARSVEECVSQIIPAHAKGLVHLGQQLLCQRLHLAIATALWQGAELLEMSYQRLRQG
mmetsp:Transcript_44003/g.110583  ORF Transcript_44003/g.110583 Transcript_44003/m.110583 type:complete len:341 (-) Transcript_44003:185-1207(-)